VISAQRITVSASTVALNTASPTGQRLVVKNTSGNPADLGPSTVRRSTATTSPGRRRCHDRGVAHVTTQLAQALTVEPLGAGRYRVSGGREPHVVTIDATAARCDCADFAYRQRACKHLRAVLDHLVLAPLTVPADAGSGLERDVPLPDDQPDGSA
jgi:hypothetical protein